MAILARCMAREKDEEGSGGSGEASWGRWPKIAQEMQQMQLSPNFVYLIQYHGQSVLGRSHLGASALDC
jgi:hypothetical protein